MAYKMLIDGPQNWLISHRQSGKGDLLTNSSLFISWTHIYCSEEAQISYVLHSQEGIFSGGASLLHPIHAIAEKRNSVESHSMLKMSNNKE